MQILRWIKRLLAENKRRRRQARAVEDNSNYVELFVTRLEERRVMNADFALAGLGDSLDLTNFDGTTTQVNVQDSGSNFFLVLDNGTWDAPMTPTPGVSGGGTNTLIVDKTVITNTVTFDDAGAGSDVDISFEAIDLAADPVGALVLSDVGDVTQTGAIAMAGSSTLTLNAQSITLDDPLNDFATVSITSAAAVSIADTNDLILDGATVTGPLTVSANGTISVTNAVSAGANDITFEAAEIDLAGNDSVAGSGSIALRPRTDSLAINIGNAVDNLGQLDITDSDLDALADGFSSITIGRATGQHDITVDSSTFADPVTIQTPIGGSIAVGGLLTGTDDASITLDGSGATTTLSANIVTAGGAINISDAVLVDGAILLDTTGGGTTAAASVSIAGAIDGANAGGADTLTIDAADVAGNAFVTLLGDVEGQAGLQTVTGGEDLEGLVIDGGQIDLASVTVNGGVIDVKGTDIDLNGTTYQTIGSGTITFTGPVGLNANVAITSAGGAADGVLFSGAISTVDSEGGARTLEVQSGMAAANFDGVIGGVAALSSLTVNNAAGAGAITLANIGASAGVTGAVTVGNAATASVTFTGTTYESDGTQTYTAAAGNNFHVDGGPTTFQTSADAISFTGATIQLGNGGNLVVDSNGGAITVFGIRGTSDETVTLDANGVASTTEAVDVGTIGGGNEILAVEISGQDGVTLRGDVTTSATVAGNQIVVNGPATITGDRVIDSSNGGGTIDLDSVTAVDGSTFDLELDAGGGLIIVGQIGDNAADDNIGNVTLAGLAGVTLNGDIFTGADGADDGTVQISGATTLGADVGIDTVAGGTDGAVSFDNDVNGGQTLTIDSGNDSTSLQQVGATTAVNALDVTAATIRLFGNLIQTADVANNHVDLTGAVDLQTNVTIDTNQGTNDGTITMDGIGTVDGAQSLTLDAGGGDVNIQGAVGSGVALTGFTVQSANQVDLNSVRISNGDLDIAGTNIELNGSTYTIVNATGDDTISFTGAVDLNVDVTVEAVNGEITFDGTLDGNFNLQLNTTGVTDINGTIGGGTRLASITTNLGGTTEIGADVATQGSGQTYGDAVTLTADVTLSDTGVTGIAFNNTVDSEAVAGRSLNVDVLGGHLTFQADVGGGGRLGTLDVDSSTGTVTVSGDIFTRNANVDFSGVTGGSIVVTANDGGSFEIDTDDIQDGAGAGDILFGAVGLTAVNGSNVDLVFNAIGQGTDADGAIALNLSITAASVDFDADRITVGSIATRGGGGAGNADVALSAAAAAGTAIAFNGATIDSTNGGANAAGSITLATGGGQMLIDNGGNTVTLRSDGAGAADAAITIDAPIDAAAGEGLTLRAGDGTTTGTGTGGDVDINGSLGAGGQLGGLTILADELNFDSDVEATGITATATATVASIQIGSGDGSGITSPTLDSNGNDIVLIANGSIDANASATITSTGAALDDEIFLLPLAPAQSIGIGDGATAADVDISENLIRAIDNTLAEIVVGASGVAQTGDITINDAGGLMDIQTTLRLRAGAADVNLASGVRIVNALSDFIIDGSGATTKVQATLEIETNSGDIQIHDGLLFGDGDATAGEQFTLTLDTQAGAGNVSIDGDIRDDADDTGHLIVTAGIGNIDLGDGTSDEIGDMAANNRFGDVVVTTTGAITANVVFAETFVANGAIGGSVNFNGAIDLDNGAAGDVLDIDDKSTVTFAAAASVTTGNSGAVNLDGDGSGQLVMGTGNFLLDGEFIESDFTGVSIAADIATTNDNVTFNNAVTLTGNVDIDTAGLTGGNILFVSSIATGGNDLALDAGSAGDVTASNSITGGGNLVVRDGRLQSYQTLNVDSLDIQDATTSVTFNAASDISGDVSVTSGGTILLSDKMTAGGALVFDAVGNVTINGAIDPVTATLESDDDVIVNDLAQADNLITISAGQDGTGSAIVNTSGGLSTTSAGSDISVTSGAAFGGITLDGDVTAVDRVKLTSNGGGDITQGGGALSAANLQINAVGATTLAQANNDVDTIAASTAGAIEFQDRDDLQVGTVATVGINSTDGDVTLCATELTITQNITAGLGTVRLQATAGGIDQMGGAITASALGAIATTSIDLSAAANDVDTFAASASTTLSFVDDDGYSIEAVAALGCFTSGVTGLAGMDIELCVATGDISISATINATGTLRLQTDGGHITQSAAGVITAANLGARATGNVDLNTATNAISGTFAAASTVAGFVEFANTGGFTVGTVAANSCFTLTIGVSTIDGAVTIESSGGTIVVDDAITTTGVGTGGGVSLSGGLMVNDTLTTGGGQIVLNGLAAGDIEIGADVTAADGDVTFHSATELTADITVAAGTGAITFDGTIDGNFNLQLNTTGVTDINATVGGLDPLASITTNLGGTTELGADISTQGGTQTYNDAVTLTADVLLTDIGATGITFENTVDSDAVASRSLTVNVPNGSLTFQDDVGTTRALASIEFDATQIDLASVTVDGGAIDVEGTSIRLNGTAYQTTTSGAITFTGPVELNASLTNVLIATAGGAGDDISFSGTTSTIDGAVTLTLDAGSDGNITLAAAVGGATPLTALNVTDGAVQSYEGIAAGGLTISAATTSVTFNAVSDISGDVSVTSGGTIQLSDKMTASGTLIFDATGDVTIDGAIDPTTVTLESDDNVIVNDLVQADDLITISAGQDGTGSALVNTTGSLLTTSAGSDISVTSGATSGGITLDGDVTAVDRVILTSNGGGDITQGGGALSAANLQINAVGATTLAQANNDVDTIAASTNGAIEFHDRDDLQVGTVATAGINSTNGNVTLCATELTLTQSITAGLGTVRLHATDDGIDQTGGAITAAALGAIATTSINLSAAANDVDSFAASASTTLSFVDDDGYSIDAVAALGCFTSDVTGLAGTDIELCVAAGDIGIASAINATGTLRLQTDGGHITQSAAGVIMAANLGARATGNVDLNTATNAISGTFAAASTVAGIVEFANDGDFTVGTVTAGNCFDLTIGISTIDGNVTIDASSAPGGTITIANSISTAGSGTGGDVTITGGVTIDDTLTARGGPIVLNGAAAGTISIGADVDADEGNVSFNSVTTLTDDVTINADNGTITFNATLDGNFNLQLNTTGVTDINATVGGLDPLASITTNLGGTTELGADISTQGGTQTYNDAVTLTADVLLTDIGATGITFENTVNSDAVASRSLTVNVPNGNLTFKDDVGTTRALASLTVQNAGVVALDDTTTNGAVGIQIGSSSAVTQIILNGSLDTTDGDAAASGGSVTLNSDNIDLGATVTIDVDDDAGTDGPIVIGATAAAALDATSAGAEGLNVRSGDGAVTIHGDIGGNVRLGTVDFDSSAGTVTVSGDIFTQNANVDFSGVTGGAIVVTANDGGSFEIDTDDIQDSAGAGDILFGAVGLTAVNGSNVDLVFNAIGQGTDADGAIALNLSITAASVDFDADRITVGSIATRGGGGAGNADVALSAAAAAGTAIAFNGATIDSTNGGANAAGSITLATGGGQMLIDNGGNTVTLRSDGAGASDEAITINAPINAAVGEGLTLRAGDGTTAGTGVSGDIDINGSLGTGVGGQIGVLTIFADELNFDSDVEATGIAATATETAASIQIGSGDGSGMTSPTLDSNGNDIVLIANGSIDANASATITSTGIASDDEIFLLPLAPAQSIGIGDGATAADVDISENLFQAIDNTLAEIIVGAAGAGQTGDITIVDAGGLTDIHTTLRLRAGAADVNLASDVRIINAGSDFIIDGSGATTNVRATLEIETIAGDIEIHDSLLFGDGDANAGEQLTLTLDTQAGAGNVSIDGDIRDDADDTGHLIVTAGIGNIDLGDGTSDEIGDMAANNRFGDVVVATTGSITANVIFAESFVASGAIGGSVNFNGAINLDNGAAGDVLDIDDKSTVTFAAAASVTTGNSGAVNLDGDGSGQLVIGTGQFILDGEFVESDFTAVSIAADIATTNDNVTFDNAVTLTGNVDIDTTGLTGGNILFVSSIATGGNDLALDGGSAGDVTATDSTTGGGDLAVRDGRVQSYQTLTVDSLDIQDATTSVTFNAASDISGDVSVTSGGTILLSAKMTASGTFIFDATGNVTINGAIDPATVTLESDDDVIVNDVVQADDLITVSAGQDGTGSAVVNTTGGLSTTNAGSDILVTSGATAGGITLNGNVSAMDRVTLSSNGGGNIVQGGGALTAANLQLNAVGTTTLTQAGNDVDTIAASTNGAIELRDQDDLQVGTVATAGINSTNGDVTLCATELTLTQSITAGMGTVRLQATAGGIEQTGGAISAAALGAIATASINLSAAANDVDTFAADAGTILSFVDADGYSIGAVAAQGCFTSGVTGLAGTDIEQCVTTGDINITAAINATGTVRLQSGGGHISQSAAGVITAANLGARATGNVDLNAASNAITGTFAAASTVAGVVEFADTGGFTVGTVTAGNCFAMTTGVSTTSGAIDLTTSSGDLITQDSVSAVGGSVTLTTTTNGNVKVNDVAAAGDSINIAAAGGGAIIDGNGAANNLTAKNAALQAATGIGSGGDAIETTISNLAFSNTKSGDVSIVNSGALTVTTVNALASSSNSGGAVTIVATSPITFAVNTTAAATLTARALESSPAAGNTDNITVQIGVEVSSTGADVVFEAGDRIFINAKSAVKAGAAASNVSLTSGVGDNDGDGLMTLNGSVIAGNRVTLDLGGQGAATQAAGGQILATDLLLLSTGASGAFALGTSDLNDVKTIAADTNGAIDFRDDNGVTVGTVNTTVGIRTIDDSLSIDASNAPGGTIIVDDAITTGGIGNGGAVDLTGGLMINDTLTTGGGDIILLGSTTGDINLGADISTADGEVTIHSALTLASNVDIDTASTTGGNIRFVSSVATGGNDLALDAGSAGDVTAIGSITGGGDLVVRDGRAQSYQAITIDSLDIQDATTSVDFNAAVDVTGAVSVRVDVDGGAAAAFTSLGPIMAGSFMLDGNGSDEVFAFHDTLQTNSAVTGAISIRDAGLVDFQADVTAEKSLTVENIGKKIRLDAGVDLQAESGDLDLNNNVGLLELAGPGTHVLTAQNGNIELAATVDSGDVVELELNADNDINVDTIVLDNLAGALLDVHLDVDGGGATFRGNGLTAGQMTLNGTGADDTFRFDDRVETTDAATGTIAISNADTVQFGDGIGADDDVTARTSITIENVFTQVDLADNVGITALSGPLSIVTGVTQINLSGGAGTNNVIDSSGDALVQLTKIVGASPDSLTIKSEGGITLDTVDINSILNINFDDDNDTAGSQLSANQIDANELNADGGDDLNDDASFSTTITTDVADISVGDVDLLDLNGSLTAASSITIEVMSELNINNGVTANGGGITIEVMSGLNINAPVRELGGGSVLLIASGDLNINNGAPGPTASDVEVVGAGTIRGVAGGNVTLSAPSGEFVIVRTATGEIVNVPAVVSVVAVDQGGSNVNALGVGMIDVTIGDPGTFDETNFRVITNWNDFPINSPVDDFPFPGNASSNPATEFDAGTHRFSHTYGLGNPDILNPAADIPVDVTVRFDPRPGVIEGIQFFASGNFLLETTVRVMLTVPGEGLAGFVIISESEIVPVESRDEATSFIAQPSTDSAIDATEDYVTVAVAQDDSVEDLDLLYFTIISPDGRESEPESLQIDLLEKDRILDLFKTFPNNVYHIYLKQAGTTDVLRLYRIEVIGNKIRAPEGDAPEGNTPNEPANEGAEKNPAAPPDDGASRGAPRLDEHVSFQPSIFARLETESFEASALAPGLTSATIETVVPIIDSADRGDTSIEEPHALGRLSPLVAGAIAASGLIATGTRGSWRRQVDEAMQAGGESLSATARLIRRLRK